MSDFKRFNCLSLDVLTVVKMSILALGLLRCVLLVFTGNSGEQISSIFKVEVTSTLQMQASKPPTLHSTIVNHVYPKSEAIVIKKRALQIGTLNLT
jgi:hypothetical protein